MSDGNKKTKTIGELDINESKARLLKVMNDYAHLKQEFDFQIQSKIELRAELTSSKNEAAALLNHIKTPGDPQNCPRHVIYKNGGYFNCPKCGCAACKSFPVLGKCPEIHCHDCDFKISEDDYERDHLPDNMNNFCRDCGEDLR